MRGRIRGHPDIKLCGNSPKCDRNDRQALVSRGRQTTANIPDLLHISSVTLDSYLISLSLILRICKMGIRILTFLDCFKDYR